MSDYLPPSMPEGQQPGPAPEPFYDAPVPASPGPDVPAVAPPPEPTVTQPPPPPADVVEPVTYPMYDDTTTPFVREPSGRPSAVGRLVSLIVSIGLAFAIAVALTAWLVGLALGRG